MPEQLAHPPRPLLPPGRSIREAVAVEGDPELLRRGGRERIAPEEGCDDRGCREAPREQVVEVALAWRAAEQQEPELEVHPRLVRCDEGRRPLGVARLVAELVRQPRDAVGGSLEHDFPPHERHLGEEMVGVHGSVGIEDLADGGELAVEIAQRWHQRQELDHGERDEDGDRPGEERGTGGHVRTGARRPQPPPDGCRAPAELPVVEQEEGERDRQVVEEGVVPGEEDR